MNRRHSRRSQEAARGRGRDNRPAWLVQQERQQDGPPRRPSVKETARSKQEANDTNRRPQKRARVVAETVLEEPSSNDLTATEIPDEVKDEDEMMLLNEIMVDDGDDFISQEEREEQAAKQRRLARRRKLQEKTTLENDFPPREPTAKEDIITEPATTQSVQQHVGNNKDETSHLDQVQQPNDEKDDDEDDDDFDMFSSSVSPPAANQAKVVKHNSSSSKKQQGHFHQQDWDDEEGYYKGNIGEIIEFALPEEQRYKFRVLGIVGKGVFSTVLKCETQESAASLPKITAMKLIRHNETMAKAAMTEIQHLQKLSNHPRNNNANNKDDASKTSSSTHHGIVRLWLPDIKKNTQSHTTTTTASSMLEHRGHVALVFDYAPYNLRHVLQKFGRGVGLSLEGVRTYFFQLLAALRHLEKHNLIHADLKPDNILVSEDFGTIQLCDFGSAFEVGSDSIPTPYLVSRFYRAPEIILGLIPTPAVDLWSVAVTMAELFLGRVLFDGRSNNDMLHQFMGCLGPFSNRMLRQHAVACQKFPLPPHFTPGNGGGTYVFLRKTSDKVTGQDVTVSTTLSHFPTTPLQQRLLKAKSAKDLRVHVLQFSDLLHKCLALDPSRRIALSEALKHDFFKNS